MRRRAGGLERSRIAGRVPPAEIVESRVIVSVSRRTDIPAFYSDWFMRRLRAGFCTVPNPFNPNQISRVSLNPEDVDAIVFWTRDPKPMLPHLAELDGMGYRYYFLYTLMDNPRTIDPGAPSAEAAVETFLRLSGRIGPERVIWRYDPIFLTTVTGPDFHRETHRRIASSLRGHAARCVVSIAHDYRKLKKRMGELAGKGITPLAPTGEILSPLMRSLAECAARCGMEIRSCSSEYDLEDFGILPGRCVDGELIAKLFGVECKSGKDPRQRERCGCAPSKDIGMYDSCLFGCRYCYATSSFERARANYRRHNPESPSLL